MKIYTFALTFALSTLFNLGTALAAPSLNATVEAFVKSQTQNLDGTVTTTIGQLDSRQQLPPCADHQAFLPPGARLLGNTSVGVRCLTPSTWSVYIPVRVSVLATYVVTSRAVPNGIPLTSDDLNELRGDLANLPAGTLSRKDQAVGKTLRFAMGAGQTIRTEQLTSVAVIKQNQSVRIIARGNGFSASTEGKSLGNAGVGELVQVRTSSGSVVSGIVQPDGTVSVSTGN